MATETERIVEQLDNIWQQIEKARQAYETAIDLVAAIPLSDYVSGRGMTFDLSLTELTIGTDQRLIDFFRREVKSC